MTRIDEQTGTPAEAEQAEGLEVRIARQLLEQAKDEGVSLVGPGGLLAGVTKTGLADIFADPGQGLAEWIVSSPGGAQMVLQLARSGCSCGTRRCVNIRPALAGLSNRDRRTAKGFE